MASNPLMLKEIDAALHSNLASLKEACCDLLAAFVLVLIAICSLVHAVLRFAFAVLGLFLWVVALLITFLEGIRAWSVSRSASSLHHRRS